mgnify:CR=1 FL=1
MEKRRSMCALTWVPSPSVNRPCDSFCSVHALIAVTYGLRGNAIATAVNAVPANDPLNRARTAFYLVVSSSQYQVER